MLILPIAAYFLGSIPFGLIVSRLFGAGDLRNIGSGNIGATNVLRASGIFPAVVTLFADSLKGALPVWYALSLSSASDMWYQVFIAIVACSAFLGHLFPVYTRFRDGGKGVATAAGCLAIISPMSLVMSLLFFVLIVCMTSRVSAGSLIAVALLPIFVWKFAGSVPYTTCSIVFTVLIWVRHKENIIRLLSGKEPPVGR